MFPAAEREIESRAAVQLRFSPDAPTVFFDDALHRSQTYAGALELFGQMQALEYSKQLVHIFHIEAHSVVLHKERFPLFFFRLADLDHGGRPRPGILQGIAY